MTTPTDLDGPRAAIEAYAEATRARDVAALKRVFHPTAVMSGWMGGTLLMGGPEPFYSELEKNEVGEDYRWTIASLHVDGRIATGALVEENLLGTSFANHFHLIHDGDGWRIISKLWRHG